jgi:hypothetical protein
VNAILIRYCHFPIIEIIKFSNDILASTLRDTELQFLFRVLMNSDFATQAAERSRDDKEETALAYVINQYGQDKFIRYESILHLDERWT